MKCLYKIKNFNKFYFRIVQHTEELAKSHGRIEHIHKQTYHFENKIEIQKARLVYFFLNSEQLSLVIKFFEQNLSRILACKMIGHVTKILVKYAFLKIRRIEKANITLEREILSDKASEKIIELKAEIDYLDSKYQEALEEYDELTEASMYRVEIINVLRYNN